MENVQKPQQRRSRGFRKTASLVEDRLRAAGESRGFAVTRLITQWEQVVGPDIAQVCEPVKVSYAKGGLGATLTVLTTGAHAPILTMQTDMIRQKVNACYGYNAISRVRLTQTAPVGFRKPSLAPQPKTISADIRAEAAHTTTDIQDPALRAALADFGANVMSQPKK